MLEWDQEAVSNMSLTGVFFFQKCLGSVCVFFCKGVCLGSVCVFLVLFFVCKGVCLGSASCFFGLEFSSVLPEETTFW